MQFRKGKNQTFKMVARTYQKYNMERTQNATVWYAATRSVSWLNRNNSFITHSVNHKGVISHIFTPQEIDQWYCVLNCVNYANYNSHTLRRPQSPATGTKPVHSWIGLERSSLPFDYERCTTEISWFIFLRLSVKIILQEAYLHAFQALYTIVYSCTTAGIN